MISLIGTPDRFRRLHHHRVHNLGNLYGRRRSPLSQLTHFISHHSKATPLLTRPRRLNGRIQSQQIRLIGNVTNNANDAFDLFRLTF